MYYEDENNLYHYSYRKGDKAERVRDADYAETSSEPLKADPWEEKKPKKNRLGMKLAALALVCALIGGATGAGITHHAVTSAHGSTEIAVSDRQVAEVQTVKVDGKKQLTMPEVYAANVNSVVSINVSTTTNVFGRTTESAASGSGFFITKDGYILTNYHVIEGANTVKVTTYDGTTYDAAVIGGDEDYDIAVIKVEGTGFQPVVIGKSGSVQIGETVAAVGNPLGELTFSMSQGIVSCVNRAINVDGKPFNMIQVDCSINPGNSGGPLFNSYGEVIGIVSAKYSSYSNTTVEGIGFAIPIDDVLAMVKDIMTNGYVTNKAYIGITPQTMNAQMAQQFRYDVTQGVFVCSVEEGSAAEKAGLKMGDVITKIDDKTITSYEDLVAVKKSYSAGDTATFTIYREGKTQTVELTFDAAPQTQETAQDSSQQQQGGSNGGYYYNPWDFFNSFFGNGYYGSSYSGESRDAA
ncbi:trypsin-like peptidase domain-containing protein [Oscillibacter valericigenes]|nr:trypsin-like peptidase domain-containing protein [Oscillibacter valericigenes]